MFPKWLYKKNLSNQGAASTCLEGTSILFSLFEHNEQILVLHVRDGVLRKTGADKLWIWVNLLWMTDSGMKSNIKSLKIKPTAGLWTSFQTQVMEENILYFHVVIMCLTISWFVCCMCKVFYIFLSSGTMEM